jgi:hypothetical protein
MWNAAGCSYSAYDMDVRKKTDTAKEDFQALFNYSVYVWDSF